MSNATLAEAYQRLHHAGPEWDDNSLTNHGPMTVEVLVRRGRSDDVHPWVDGYVTRLDDLPAATDPITDDTWREAMGDAGRVSDWTAYLARQTAERPWRDVLTLWWPRLLPAIAAGTTHGVIRTSHAVRALLADDESDETRAELAHGLAFWAARAQYVPGVEAPAGSLDAGDAFRGLPRIGSRRGTVAGRFAQLGELPSWPGSLTALRPPADPDDARARLADLVDAAAAGYLGYGHASPVLLVHTATAPNAVLHTLPALPRELWADSLTAAWAACAAITATYAPGRPPPREELPAAPTGDDLVTDMVDRSVAHGDEHVIKFTDTAVESYQRTGNPDTLAACVRAAELIGS
ncbi:MAG TPA: hypothetical protein VGP26_25895 [Actinophytocola sp.]|jgi:hypothetical protein|nr:hypothetical protein [Actinophytocola sp.]